MRRKEAHEFTKYIFDNKKTKFSYRAFASVEIVGSVAYLANEKENEIKQDNQSEGVFITRTGAKYHIDGCKWLKSRIPISLADAGTRGYTSCRVCNPPSIFDIH